MTLLIPAVCLVAFVAALPSQWIPTNRDWDEAAKMIHRLSPSSFPQLPAAIVSDLNRRRCTIPQADGESRPHNVIRGSFIRKGQIDWAVLCSRDGESSILVFRAGSAEVVSQLAKGSDKTWLQTVGDGKIGYSRMIKSADGPYIVGHHEAFGGPKPPPIDHEGIEDAFQGKASIILCYYRGKWLRLTGAD